jgi:flagellin-like hook-associated protein FlgL
MVVNLNKSTTVSTRVALGRNVENLARVSESLATGNAIVDASGRSIGSSLQGDAQVLDVVLTGLKQTRGMFYIAEQGIKSIYDTATQMTQVISKAKLGYMNDDLIKTTLAPVYKQLKAEIDRIADAINFNNQTLFNGVAGGNTKTSPVKSTISTKDPSFDKAKIASAKLVPSSATKILTGVQFDKVGSTTTTLTAADFGFYATNDSSLEFGLFDATYDYDSANNKTIISNVDLIYKKLSYTTKDTPASPAIPTTLTGTTDVILPKRTIEIAGNISVGELSKTGIISFGAITYVGATHNPRFDHSFNSDGVSTTLSISTTPTTDSITVATEKIPTANGNTSVTANGQVTITGIEATNDLIGGKAGSISIGFVTNRDLFNSNVSFDFPTVTLNKLIPTLTSENFRGAAAPINLSDLENKNDANIDIALVDALVQKMVVEMGNISAAQVRINNIIGQVETQTDETYKAMSEILHTDIPSAVEKLAQTNANVQLTMVTLQRMTKFVEQLLVLVQ